MGSKSLNGESNKKSILNNSLFCHIKYKIFIHKRKFSIILEDYLGIDMRYYLLKNALSFGWLNFWWFAPQIDARNLIIERNSDFLVERFFKNDKLRVDDIIELYSGHRAIHTAVIFDDIFLVDYLIQQDAHLMARDWNGYTPLLKAAAFGRLEICKKLINAGVPLNHKDPWGNTPLDKAKLYNQKKVIDYFNSLSDDTNKENEKVFKEKEFKEKFNLTVWYMKQF